jgi:tetratricopeptide (TPR) repeat protein
VFKCPMFRSEPRVWLMSCASLICVSLISGCAGYSGKSKEALSIRPVMRVAHGDASSEAIYRLGRYHQGNAHHTAAITAYRKVLAMSPNHVEACNGLAVSYSMQGQYDLALQYLERALALSPDAAHLHNNLGYIHMTEGRISKAAAAFEQALMLDPENRWARANVGVLYEKVGLNPDAAGVTEAPSRFLPTDVAVAITPRAPAAGASSVSFPANVATSVERNHGRQGKQGKGEKQEAGINTHTQLVQIAPGVFEFRPYQSQSVLHDDDSHGASRDENLVVPGMDRADGKGIRIEVSNGSGIAGMAREVSNFLRENGFPQARLTDRQPFRQLQTEIHYRPGSYKLAEQIGKMMPKQILVKEGYNLRQDIQVRILLGADIARPTAYSNTGGSTNASQSGAGHFLNSRHSRSGQEDRRGG